jgi:hypothetical protein
MIVNKTEILVLRLKFKDIEKYCPGFFLMCNELEKPSLLYMLDNISC